MTTNPTNPTIQPLQDAVKAIAQMERHAHQNGRYPFALSMHPSQWAHLVNYTMQACQLTVVPKEMAPRTEGELGSFHGMPVLPMAAQGIAMHHV